MAHLLPVCLLAWLAPAQAEPLEYGPPAASPPPAPVTAQVRMTQEGDHLRVIVDAMSGDAPVSVVRPVHVDAAPLLEGVLLRHVTPEQLEAHERAMFAAYEAREEAEEDFPAHPELTPPEGGVVDVEPPAWRIGRRDDDVVELVPGVWTPVAEAAIPLPEAVLRVGGRVVLRSDVRLTLADGTELVPAPDVAIDLRPHRSAG